MSLLLGTFGFAVASALIPVLNVEAYLAIVAAKLDDPSLWGLALVAGGGQTVGKIVWFYAGWHSLKLSWMQKKLDNPKFQASYTKWHGRIVGRPVFAGAIVFASAWTGFPPLAVVAVLAGVMRMSFPVFLVTTFIGRTLRFWTVLAGVDLLKDVVPGLFG